MIVNKTNPEVLDILVPLLKDGGTAIIPCDTIYGLCAMYKIGEKALRNIKSRNRAKKFLVLATLDQAKTLSDSIPEDVIKVWPAPLTAIVGSNDDSSLAIRIPNDLFLKSLLTRLGSPIYSTSVNTSGEPELLDFTSICNRFEALVDIVVKGQEVQGTVPSTLIDTTTKPYKILRKGAFDASVLVKESSV